nr:hypothetical protein [Tanacetum cinerariifolium]
VKDREITVINNYEVELERHNAFLHSKIAESESFHGSSGISYLISIFH